MRQRPAISVVLGEDEHGPGFLPSPLHPFFARLPVLNLVLFPVSAILMSLLSRRVYFRAIVVVLGTDILGLSVQVLPCEL